MITVSNKNLSPTVIKAETSIPVYDETGKNPKSNEGKIHEKNACPWAPGSCHSCNKCSNTGNHIRGNRWKQWTYNV